MNTPTEFESISDAQLVALSLQGKRDAFAEVVARYQSLICGISYSACGDVGRSEDLAQETFVAAWKDLAALKEPGKLKSWLCGIARHLINNSHRVAGRTPTGNAEPLPAELACEGPSPDEHAMSKEEESLVWRALETIPPDYREPMVLFYRQGQSTQAVAAALDLSDEAVRQRLSRGRVMLNERVARTVESALLKSGPGKMFAVGVLAALPVLSISAKAATLGASATKGSGVAKAAAAAGLLGGILGAVLPFFAMWMGYRSGIESAHSDRERAFIRTFYRRLIACILGFGAILLLLMYWAKPLLARGGGTFVGLALALGLTYCLVIGALTVWCTRVRRRLLAEQTISEPATDFARPLWEYRSKLHLLGLPFIHLRFGERLAPPVKAWIASGGCAYGVLFAFGGLAVAPVSVGGCAIGLFAFGGLGVGVLVLGGFAAGVWSFGGMAVGWQAVGGCVLAWNAAMGGIAIAWEFALGGIACAAQANNQAAQHFCESQWFLRASTMVEPYIVWLNLVWFAPLVWQRRLIARHHKAMTSTKASNSGHAA